MSAATGYALITAVIGLQAAAGPLYEVCGIRPDFPCIALAAIALTLQPFGVITTAILAGALLDWTSAGTMGAHMTGCLCLAFFILRGRRTGWDEDRPGRIVLVTGGILIALIVPHGMIWAIGERHANPAILYAGTAAYTILFAWPLYRLVLPVLEWSLPGERWLGQFSGGPSWQRRA